jgi:hypothetical protein
LLPEVVDVWCSGQGPISVAFYMNASVAYRIFPSGDGIKRQAYKKLGRKRTAVHRTICERFAFLGQGPKSLYPVKRMVAYLIRAQ